MKMLDYAAHHYRVEMVTWEPSSVQSGNPAIHPELLMSKLYELPRRIDAFRLPTALFSSPKNFADPAANIKKFAFPSQASFELRHQIQTVFFFRFNVMTSE